MKTVILVLFCLLPMIGKTEILFKTKILAASDILWGRNRSLMRNAMLEANGKAWFMKHIIQSDRTLSLL